MTIELTTMYDTIHDSAGHIPADAKKAAGYLTGTPDIQWTQGDWKRLEHAGLVRVDQSPDGWAYAEGKADVYDMEANAGTPARFAGLAAGRYRARRGNCGYGSHPTLQAAAEALARVPGLPDRWWVGTECWLADPDLSLAEASAFIGTMLYGGLAVTAVQWATPSSNPNTQVPGGTLKSLNLDLSVAAASWHPAPPAPAPPTWQQQALAHLHAAAALLEEHQ